LMVWFTALSTSCMSTFDTMSNDGMLSSGFSTVL
jgi:hypothetical protein